jgi:hypothetical protein
MSMSHPIKRSSENAVDVLIGNNFNLVTTKTRHFLPSNENMTRKHGFKKSNRNKINNHFFDVC